MFPNTQQGLMNGLRLLMFDAFPSTLPVFYVGRKCSNVIGSDTYLRLNRYDGTNVLATSDFAFGTDNLIPEAAILAFGGSDQVLIETTWAHNLPGVSLTQPDPQLRPVIASGGAIRKNAANRVAPYFPLGAFMEVENSLGMFNALHDGTKTSYCVIAQRSSGTTRGMIAGNRLDAGEEGFLMGMGTFFSQANSATARNEIKPLKANYVTGAAADGSSHTLWVNTDLTNAIPAERLQLVIDGFINNNNTQSFTDAPTMANASNNMRWGSGAVNWEFEGYSEGLFFYPTDQRDNRETILSYLDL